MSANAVVFIGMVYPWGIIRHFALLGVELYKTKLGFDFFFASIERSPDNGAWNIVDASISTAAIIKKETFAEIVSACDDLFAKYDKVLVHCGGGWGQTKAFLPLRKKYGKRLVLVGTTHSYRHDSWMRIPMSAFQSLLYLAFYDKIVFQCQYAADKFWGARMLFARHKGCVIPLGCEPFESPDATPPVGIAAKPELCALLMDKALFKLVYLAGFRPGKKHVWLVESIAPVLRKHPEARLLFCGTGDESVIADVRTAIAMAKMENQIILTGQIQRQEVPWLLMHSNCAVVPSRAETFGHNFLEPMFAGLPVVGTPVGIGRDIIINGETGRKFSLSSRSSLQAAVESVVSDPAMARQMGEKAQQMVLSRFKHSDVAKELVSLYSGLLNG